MADPDMSLERRRELKQQAARGQAGAAARDEATPAQPGDAAQADPRLLRIEQKLDRLARQISGLPTLDSLRTTMIVLAALAVGIGLAGGSMTHP